MPFPEKTARKLGEILVEMEVISAVHIHRVLKKQAEMRAAKGYQIRLGELLLREKLIDERSLARAVAAQFGVDYLELEDVEVDLEEYASIPWDIVKRASFVPLRRGAVDLTIAIDEEPDQELFKVLDASRSGDVFFVASPRSEVQLVITHVRRMFEAGTSLKGLARLKDLRAEAARAAGGTGAAAQAVAADPRR